MFDPKTRILIVDDMLTMRKIINKSCQNLGFSNITEAVDGAEAWKLVSEPESSYGLIISDWNMPNLSGLAFLKQVRADARLKHSPFVLLTAESEAKQVTEALIAGVDNYIVKPFSPDGFQKKIAETYKKVSARKAA